MKNGGKNKSVASIILVSVLNLCLSSYHFGLVTICKHP